MFKTTSNTGEAFGTGPAGPVFYATIVAALIGFGLFLDNSAMSSAPQAEALATLHADLRRERASPEVEQVARWAVDSQDHAGLPFVVVDKARARLFAFAATGQLLASAPVLLGAGRGDGPAAAAATPAGRFVAASWLSDAGDGIAWLNADAALSLHAIPSGVSPGHSVQRLAPDDIEDRRISDGSLHVARPFYRDYLGSLKGQASIAYVLPEVLPLRDVFNLYETEPHFGFAQSPRSQGTGRRPS